MEKIDMLLRVLEPEIDMKCAELKQKKSEKLLTSVFISLAALLLVIPAVLVFFGISMLSILLPIVIFGAVFSAMLSILMNKGADSYDRI